MLITLKSLFLMFWPGTAVRLTQKMGGNEQKMRKTAMIFLPIGIILIVLAVVLRGS